ncbi:hypothetical protein PJL18_04057 [Paenarthrobacter nicotinovorans]|nr:hypothetical protein [Paenarthrobacter nicotinovorans]
MGAGTLHPQRGGDFICQVKLPTGGAAAYPDHQCPAERLAPHDFNGCVERDVLCGKVPEEFGVFVADAGYAARVALVEFDHAVRMRQVNGTVR